MNANSYFRRIRRSTLGGVSAISASLFVLIAPAAAAAPPQSPDETVDITYIRSGDGDTLRVIFYEDRGFGGDQLRYYGGSSCTPTLSDADYSLSRMPSGWNDRISSVRDYNSCDVKLYTDDSFGGNSTGYINYGSSGRDLSSTFNDRTSSFRVS